LNTTPLPPKIQLYSPSILGYSYYDENTTNEFIKTLHKKYKRIPEITRPKYTDFCLKEINVFEKKHVRRLKDKLEYEYELGVPHGSDRKDRLFKLEVTTMKPRVEWKQHHSYITEKTYDMYPDPYAPKLPSCIIIFCENVKRNVEDIVLSYNQPSTKYYSKDGKLIKYTVVYDSDSSTFMIDFGDTTEEDIPFEEIKDIILFLLFQVGTATVLHDINLAIFDFTCSELEFPRDDKLSGLTPTTLSFNNTDRRGPKLVYGTIPEETVSMTQTQQNKLWPSFHPSVSPRLNSSSISPSPSPSRSQYLSPARANPLLVVRLNGEVASFADFNPNIPYESMSNSGSPSITSMRAFEVSPSVSSASSSSSSSYGPVFALSSSGTPTSSQGNGNAPVFFGFSPNNGSSVSVPRPSPTPIEVDGGSQHTRSSLRSRRRHRHVGNKVSRKQMIRRYHRRNRHTKVHSKRSKRQRGTTK
jgi:hypothetical protein